MQIHELGAVELAAAMTKGELSSEEVVRALQAHTAAVDGSVNAWAHKLHEQALGDARARDAERRAGQVRGPLHGLPVTIKENIDTAGLPSTMGLRARQSLVAANDAVIVRALRDAGAVIIGKGNVPQFLLAMETVNELWGRTNNPWNPARAAGGSSGGEAAALASRQSVLGVGTDIGGSIRQPAAFCGVAGLKPTLYRWSNVGCMGAMPGQESIRAQSGPMARTVADLSLLFCALDPVKMAAVDPLVPPLPIRAPADVDLRGLRVGVYDDDGLFTPSPALRRAVREAAAHLQAAGATLVEFRPPNAARIAELYFMIVSADGTTTMMRQLQGQGLIQPLQSLARIAQMPDLLRALVAWLLGARGEARVSRLLRALGRKTVADLWRLTAEIRALQVAEQAAWSDAGVDLVLCPPHTTPAVLHDESHDFSFSAIYAMRYNLLQLPAGTVPVTKVRPDEEQGRTGSDRLERKAAKMDLGSAGLPACVQLVGRPWREDVVLAGMAAIDAGAGFWRG